MEESAGEMRLGIIGAGGMGRAVARRAALAGADVLLADHRIGKARAVAAEAAAGAPGSVTPTTVDAALRPRMVVLALGWPAAMELISARTAALRGKALVDVSVPSQRDALTSGVRRLAQAAPRARWVKAFAAGDAEALFRGEMDGQPVDVFVASDDERAKVAVVELVDLSGLRAFDAGGLDNARGLEDMARLGQEMRDRLLLTAGWGFKFLPCW